MKIQHSSAVRAARLLGLALTPLMLAAVHNDAHAMSAVANPSLQSDTAYPDTATDVVNAFHAALKRGDAAASLQLMAEDVVTTGLSSREAIAAIEAAGGVVVAAASVVDRSAGTVELGVPFYPLIELNFPTYAADELPPELAATEAVKPGSRKI